MSKPKKDTDVQVAHQIQRRISRYGYGSGGIEVQFENGVATILGRVTDARDKIQVEKIDGEDSRVKKIWNSLSVFESPGSMFYRGRL